VRVSSGGAAGSPTSAAGSQAVLASTAPSLWGDAAGAEAVGPASRRIEHPDPLEELTQAREELATQPDRALLRLALVLRADPTLAPDVLDALSLRREPMAAIIRGDAQRLLGRHLEAEATFTSAGDTLDRPERPNQR
jgi:hypothetical protein